MRTLLFSIVLLLFFGRLNAQDMHIIGGDILVQGTLDVLGESGELQAAWDVQNISSSELSVRAKRVIETEVSGSGNYFCWGVCFLETTNVSPVSVAQVLQPGEINSSFYAHYRPYGNAGQTVINYCFFETGNESNEVCQKVNFCVDGECVVSVEEKGTPVELSDVYPNPFSGLGKINYRFEQPVHQPQMTFYNAMGAIVKQIRLNGNEGIVILNSEDFESGIYFYTLSHNGVLGTSRRMSVVR